MVFFIDYKKWEFKSKNLPSVCLRQEDHHQKRHTNLVARTVDSGARLSGVMSQLQPAVAMWLWAPQFFSSVIWK